MRRVPVLLLSIIAVVGLAGSRTLGAQLSTPVEELLSKAGQYVSQLEESWAVVMGDETYRQDVWFRSAPGARGGGTHGLTRTIQSEMLFMWLPDEDLWISVRNVLSVDRRPVTDSTQRLDKILSQPGFDYVTAFHRLQAESARYDIGQVWRTTGNPSLVLRFFLPRNQSHFRFGIAGQERKGNRSLVKIAFAEIAQPTFINFNGQDVTSSGTAWIDPVDGTITRTNLEVKTPTPMDVSIVVDYQRDERLQLWVPSLMEERYAQGFGDLTTCSARYSHFRRFETSGRVIFPK
jgi:hypothetical protein